MENAGSHGTNGTTQKYELPLSERFNIDILWQPPRFPELNLLDLGVWRTLRIRTEKLAYELRNTKETIWTAAHKDFSQIPPENSPMLSNASQIGV